jgi:hypothetical protein
MFISQKPLKIPYFSLLAVQWEAYTMSFHAQNHSSHAQEPNQKNSPKHALHTIAPQNQKNCLFPHQPRIQNGAKRFSRENWSLDLQKS